MSIDYMMKISDEQQKILDKAVELLKKYDKQKVTDWIYYFVVSEDNYEEISSEYDCCDNKECYEKTLKKIRKEVPESIYLYQDNNSDHENINFCYQCNTALNDSLTWIEYELDRMEENDFTKENLQLSSTAFEFRVIFEAMPTCDCEISGYAKAHLEELPAELKEQSDFVIKVVGYAQKVIDCLEG